MFYKYLKLILLSTVLIQASPKAFDSLGNELEAFQKDCKIFQEISSLPVKIKKKCKTFNAKTIKVFKVGYQLDPYIDSNNVNEKKLNKYLALLRNLNTSKENILSLIYTEAKKARKQNNIKYYSQLIANKKVKLYASDYKFMEKNKDTFAKNERYLSHIRYLKALEEFRKPILTTKKQVTKDNHPDKKYTDNTHRNHPQRYNTSSVIIQNCKNKWGNDYKMVRYCIKGQSEAKSIVTSNNCQNLWGTQKRQCLDKQAKIKRALSSIRSNELSAMEKCRKKWGSNYNMVKYCAGRQGSLNKVTSSMSTDTSIMVRCRKKWGSDYKMVKYCVETQSKSYQEISSVTDDTDECKKKWGTAQRTCISKQTKRRMKLSPIIDKCKRKWGTDYNMVKYCVEKG
jgi:hypothetical protein